MTTLLTFLKSRTFIIIVGVFFVLSLVYISGCNRGKRVKICPTITTTTITVHDTVIHNIIDTFPYYIQGKTQIVYRTDTVFKNIDTIAVVRDYFSTHITDNIFQDSLIQVNLKTYISENELKHSVFKYKILREQTITYNNIDNSVNYARYIYFGASLPVYPFKVNTISNINYVGLDLIYAAPKMYLRANWIPYTKTYTLGTGIKILHFKK